MSFINPTPVEELDENMRRLRELGKLPGQGPGVAQVMENAGRWSVWLSPDATVVELAALIGGLNNGGTKVKAEHMGQGAFALMPLDETSRAPSGEWIASILGDPPRPLPSLVARL